MSGIVGFALVGLVIAVIAVWVASLGNAPKQAHRLAPTANQLPPPPPPPTFPVVVCNAQTSEALSQAQTSVSRREAEVEAALARFRATEFEALIALHHEAFQTADTAYVLYKSTEASARSVSTSINGLDRYLASLETGVARGDSRYISRKSSAHATRRQLVATARGLQEQVVELRAGVRQLNANTHTLKERIRDECGQRGRDWYTRLEARKRRRRDS